MTREEVVHFDDSPSWQEKMDIITKKALGRPNTQITRDWLRDQLLLIAQEAEAPVSISINIK